MTEQQRAKWNAVVNAAECDPSPANIARRDALKQSLLRDVHSRTMQEDSYQERTH